MASILNPGSDYFIFRVGTLKTEQPIGSVCFTEDNHFILVSIAGIRKPAQMCISSQKPGQSEREYLQQLRGEEAIYGKQLNS